VTTYSDSDRITKYFLHCDELVAKTYAVNYVYFFEMWYSDIVSDWNELDQFVFTFDKAEGLIKVETLRNGKIVSEVSATEWLNAGSSQNLDSRDFPAGLGGLYTQTYQERLKDILTYLPFSTSVVPVNETTFILNLPTRKNK
jgi:hypothetical protein